MDITDDVNQDIETYTIYGTGNDISGPPDFIHDLSSIDTAYGCRHQLLIVRMQ